MADIGITNSSEVNPVSHIHNYTTPDWEPLERAVSLCAFEPETAGEFMWMCEHPQGNHQYKHRMTRRYIHLRGNESAETCRAGMKAARE